MIHNFFVVTDSAVYQVNDRVAGKGPIVERIALRGQSDIPPNKSENEELVIPETGMISLKYKDSHLFSKPFLFEPRCFDYGKPFNHDTLPYCLVVALFLGKSSALNCLKQERLNIEDDRWIKESLTVLVEIGDRHPVFIVEYIGKLAVI
ncbi:MAG: hypothetical protein Q7S60_06080 [bacterium]|nr:hypothetical protein [bacterium]